MSAGPRAQAFGRTSKGNAGVGRSVLCDGGSRPAAAALVEPQMSGQVLDRADAIRDATWVIARAEFARVCMELLAGREPYPEADR